MTISNFTPKKKVRERNDDKKNSKVEKFAHEKVPKVNVVVLHDTYDKGIEFLIVEFLFPIIMYKVCLFLKEEIPVTVSRQA